MLQVSDTSRHKNDSEAFWLFVRVSLNRPSTVSIPVVGSYSQQGYEDIRLQHVYKAKHSEERKYWISHSQSAGLWSIHLWYDQFCSVYGAVEWSLVTSLLKVQSTWVCIIRMIRKLSSLKNTLFYKKMVGAHWDLSEMIVHWMYTAVFWYGGKSIERSDNMHAIRTTTKEALLTIPHTCYDHTGP